MNLDGYVRVSRVAGRAGASFISPDSQREAIDRWAQLHGHEIVSTAEDLDRSGGTIDRPGFQGVLERIERGETAGIVVAKLDRFARSIPAAYDAIERIQAAGGTFVSVADQFDLSTSTGKLTFNIMASFAQFERDKITEAWSDARERAVARGVHLRAPFGYQRETPKKDGAAGPAKRDADGRFLIHATEAGVVKHAFGMRAAGETWGAIARWMNKRCATARGAKWQTSTVKAMIENRVYTGTAYSGEFENRDAHPAIVTEAEFSAAQHWHQLNPNTGEGALLAGLARCSRCSYTAGRRRSKASRNTSMWMYRCKAHHGSGDCGAPVSISADAVDRIVEEAFLARLGTETVRLSATGGDIEAATLALHEAEDELDSFATDLDVRRALGQERYREAVKVRAKAVEVAKRDLAEATRQTGGPVFDVDLREKWPTYDVERKRALLRSAVDVVFLRRTPVKHHRSPVGERVCILWSGEAPAGLPRRGKRTPLRPFPWPERGSEEAGVVGL